MRRYERKLPRHLSACLPVTFPPLHQLGFSAYCFPYLNLRTSGTGEWVVTGFVLEEKEGGGGGGGDRVHGIRVSLRLTTVVTDQTGVQKLKFW
ncbi:hypothetical protein CRENBAI_025400 [Crenichthys baileyi]|uniref:Uncharacterized protein n=1 Tax=Crenichthys baileyi TaxID=28760 RepID=A0AAV9R580_9TELE